MLTTTGTINMKRMKNYTVILVSAFVYFALGSCQTKPVENEEELIVPKASVSVTSPQVGSVESRITLNGQTVLYRKNQEPTPISGYITAIHIQFGDVVKAGQVLFEIQTPENKAMEQSETGNSELSEFGKISVKATTSGIISAPLLLGTGAFVSEGSVLCTIADLNDLQIRVNVPFEYHATVKPGTKCTLLLPDHTTSTGSVISVRPFVDESSQTQEVLVKPAGQHFWPENMNLTVSFQKENTTETLLLPKKALLTNETQDEFWVMKIIQDSVAIQVPVETGIRTDSLVEIKAGEIAPGDVIILEGAYGLEDNSLVTIVNK